MGDLELLNPSCLGMASEGIQCNVAKDEQLENGEKQRRGALGGGIFLIGWGKAGVRIGVFILGKNLVFLHLVS